MNTNRIKKINHEILQNNFKVFNDLSELGQKEIMKTWDNEHWIRYCMQNTISEEEVFDPILKLIEEED